MNQSHVTGIELLRKELLSNLNQQMDYVNDSFEDYINNNQLFVSDKGVKAKFKRYLELILFNIISGRDSGSKFYANIIINFTRVLKYDMPYVTNIRLKRGHVEFTVNPLMAINLSTDLFEMILIKDCLHILLLHLQRGESYLNIDPIMAMNCMTISIAEMEPKFKREPFVTLESMMDELSIKPEDRGKIENRREFEYYWSLFHNKQKSNSKKLSKFVNDIKKNSPDNYNKLMERSVNSISSGEGDTIDNMMSNNNRWKKQEVNDFVNNEGDIAREQLSKEDVDNLPEKLRSNISDAFEEYLRDRIKERFQKMLADSAKSWDDSYPEDIANMKQMAQDLVNQSLQDGRHTMPTTALEQMLNKLYAPPIIGWTDVLKRYKGSVKIPHKKTFMRRNRRQPHRGDLLGRMKDKTLYVAIAIDTSASVSDRELAYFWNEITDILKSVRTDITVLECDTVVRRTYQIRRKSDFDSNVIGRGGTIFTPVFQEINTWGRKPDILIYLTDGYGEPKLGVEVPKNMKVLWVISNYTTNLSLKGDNLVGEVKELRISQRDSMA